MITSKPKANTITALSVFLIAVFVAFFMVLHSLLTNPAYFILKLILAPILLTIAIIVLGKTLRSIKVVRMGANKMEIFYPVSRMKVSVKVPDILGWKEEVIKTKNGEFREVKILYAQKKILKLSNKENTDYDAVIKYLKKKVKVKNR